MRWTRHLKILVPALVCASAVLPASAFAQQETPVQLPHRAALCGNADLPVISSGSLLMSPPDAAGQTDQGVLDLSAVRGSVVHMEGNLILLEIDARGMGNAAPNRELAGDNWAVVRLPGECSISSFRMGAPILAIGAPNGRGILEAVSVTETA